MFFVLFSLLLGRGSWEEPRGRLTWSLSAGLGCVTLSLLISLYYNAIVAWVLWYLLNSFQHPLPWSSCPPDLNRTGELGTACCVGLGTAERGMGCSVPSIRAAVGGGCSLGRAGEPVALCAHTHALISPEAHMQSSSHDLHAAFCFPPRPGPPRSPYSRVHGMVMQWHCCC